MNHVIIYGIFWLSFGVVHSVLTLSSIKCRLVPLLGSTYRLCYNLFSVMHIAVVFLIGKRLLGDRTNVILASDIVTVCMIALTWGGILIMAISLGQYDLGRFSGLSQLRHIDSNKDHEPLSIHGLNQWVRHPLYSGAFLYLWGNSNSPFGFWTAVFASVYLIVGTRYEERKLVTTYGEDYRLYKSNVPAFFPWNIKR